MNTDQLIAKLDELIAATRSAAIPANMRWLSAESMAAMLDMSPRQFAERLDAGHATWSVFWSTRLTQKRAYAVIRGFRKLADSQQRRGFRGIVERLREPAEAPNMPFLGTNCIT